MVIKTWSSSGKLEATTLNEIKEDLQKNPQNWKLVQAESGSILFNGYLDVNGEGKLIVVQDLDSLENGEEWMKEELEKFNK